MITLQQIEKRINDSHTLVSQLRTYQVYSPIVRRMLDDEPNNLEAKRTLRRLILLPPVPSSELDRRVDDEGEELDSYTGEQIKKLEDEEWHQRNDGIQLVYPWLFKPAWEPYEDGSRITIIDTIWNEESTRTLRSDTCMKLYSWAQSGPVPSITEDYFHLELMGERIQAEDNAMDALSDHYMEVIQLNDTEFRIAHQELYDKFYSIMEYGHKEHIPPNIIEYKEKPIVDSILKNAWKEYRESIISLHCFLGVILRLSNRYGIGRLTDNGKYDMSQGPNLPWKKRLRPYLRRLETTLYEMVDPGQGYSDWVTESEIPEHELKETMEKFHKEYMKLLRQMYEKELGKEKGYIRYKADEVYLAAVMDNKRPKDAAKIAKRVRIDLIKEIRWKWRQRKEETTINKKNIVNENGIWYMIQNSGKYKVSASMKQKLGLA